MIITFTANPSLDRTVDLGGPLVPGGVHRIGADGLQPGGKGINVALGVHRAGLPVTAVLPAAPQDALLELLEVEGLPHRASPVAGRVRTNLTVLSTPETTTKPCVRPRCVTGIPASAGTDTAEVTPGMTRTGTPASRQASHSSPPRPKT